MEEKRLTPEKEALSYVLKIAIPFFTIVFILFMCSRMGSEDPVISTKKAYYSVGEPFIVKSGKFTVTSFERIDGEDRDTVIVQYEVENIAKEEIIIVSDMVTLIDREDRIFDSDWDSSWPGSLNPGIKGTGTARFEVPKNAKGLIAAFRTDMFDFGGAEYGYVRLN